MTPLRIGTRGSDLALWQARRVAALIEGRLGRATEIVVIETKGDRDARAPIESLGEVGVFTKAIQAALVRGEVDVAVHSLKDLPTAAAEGLAIAATPERAAPNDVLIARAPLEALPPGARIGTSSRRRRVQIEAVRPDLRCEEIRGNVPTRVEKCRRGESDAVVLAAAGLDRLGLAIGGEGGLRRFDLPVDRFLPAPGQGALAIETRLEDAPLLGALDDPEVGACVAAERALLRRIEGGCTVPLGAHARRLEDGAIALAAVLGAERPGRPPARALVRATTPEAAALLAFRVLRPDAGPIRPSAALAGKRVTLTREDPDLAAALADAGAEVRTAAAIETAPLALAQGLPPCRWTLVASRKAVPALVESGAAIERVGAVGAGTARALAEAAIAVDLLAEKSDGEGLAAAFLALREPRGTSVLIPAARDGRPELRDRLAAAGYDVRPVAVYETRPLEVDLGDADIVVFASPSAVRPTAARVVAIGPATAQAAERLGLRPVVAARPTTAGILDALNRAVEGAS